MDIAIRRRFAFIEMWPDLAAVGAEREELATGAFTDTVTTFSEFGDDETLRLVPGHAYYLEEMMCGAASAPIAGLADRIESRLHHRPR